MHRMSQVHTTGLFVDGGCNDVWVHCNGAISTDKVTAQLYGSIFSTEEPSQAFVNDENQFC